MLFYPQQSPYQVGGSLPSTATTYVARQADEQLLRSLLAGNFCYVFNARQMGKSSLRVRVMSQLQQLGVQSLAIDLTSIGSQQVTLEQWYAAIAAYLVKGFQLSINLRQWWRSRSHLPVVARLAELIETVLLVEVQQPIVILIDEIDSILGLTFPTDDFFALIRTCLNQRAENPIYQRLTFALFGVTTPNELIADKTRTPFNVGQAIALEGFTAEECEILANGLREWVMNAEAVLRRIIYWTGGQPFLTQKLCQLVVVETSSPEAGLVYLADRWVDELVTLRILDNWEMQDEPAHLRTVRDRLWYQPHQVSQLLHLYQQVLQAEERGRPPVIADDSAVQLELCLIGLVEERRGYLRVKNRICQYVFNADWIAQQLNHLRPYSQALNAWVHSGYSDESRLLRGQALKETLTWSQHQHLSELESRFLAASQAIDQQEAIAKLEAERLKEVEARLTIERERGLAQQRHLKRQRQLLIGISVAMLAAAGLGLSALIQSQKAALNEAKAIVRTAEALLASDLAFESLLEAIRGHRRLEGLQPVNDDLQFQLDTILERVVLGIHQRNRLDGHTAALLAVAYSPDGTVLATAGSDTTIKLWRPDGSLIRTLEGHNANIRHLAFSPDQQRLASTGDDGLVKLWTLTGELQRTLQTDLDAIWDLSFSPDGQQLVAAGSGVAELWQVDGSRLATVGIGQPASGALSMAFSPTGDEIALGGNHKVVTLWDLQGQQLNTLVGHRAGVLAIAYSPDGELIATGSQDQTIKLWRRDGTLIKTLSHHEAGILDLAFSPDGSTLVSASYDKTLALWNRDGTLLRTLKGHQAAIHSVAFSPDGQRLASAGADNIALIWQVHNPFQQTLPGLKGAALGVIYSQDGQWLATTGAADTILVLSTLGDRRQTFNAQQSGVISLSHHPTQDFMLSTGGDRTLKVWGFDGTLKQTISDHDGAVMAADWRPSGEEIVAATASGRLYRWRADGTKIAEWSGHTVPIWDLTYSPDGSQFATAGNDGILKLWSANGQLRHELSHEAGVWRVAFSPDSKLVASSSSDNTAKIWRTEDGSLVTMLQGHTAAVWGIAFSPDGSFIVTSSIDETIKLWSLEGDLMATLKGHTAGIRGVAFHPDGSVLASAGDDTALVFWNVAEILQLDPLAYACAWIQDYLQTNAQVDQRDRTLCRNGGSIISDR